MPRFIDEIRAGCRLYRPEFIPGTEEERWKKYADDIAERLKDPGLPVILADNVARYFHDNKIGQKWGIEDYPNVAPPYDRFWIEYKAPYRDVPRGARAGMLYQAVPAEAINFPNKPANAKWIYWCDLFSDLGVEGRFLGPFGGIFWPVAGDGRLGETMWMGPIIYDKTIGEQIAIEHEVALLTICFMHCKNVKLVENKPPEKLAKRQKEKLGVEPTGWKTLVIEPLKEILRREGKSQETGLKLAMHICRGHFADYKPEGPGLFAKGIHGRFWIPSVVKGSKGEKAAPREVAVKV